MCRLQVVLLRPALAVVLGSSLSPPAASAQDTSRLCNGMSVQSVTVETNRPAFEGALAWWRKAARAVGLHHSTTSEGLVRRFISLYPGRACTEFRRAESERILRAQPFLADATVETMRVGDSVRVNVSTVDEVAAVAGGRLRGTRLQAISLGTLNFRGAGMRLEGRWEDGRAYRDGFGARLAHYQMLGRPYVLDLEGARRPIGEHYSAELSHPFFTDLQRIAWHTGFWTSRELVHLWQPGRIEVVQPIERTLWNVGGVLRFGAPRRLGLIGGMIIGERSVPRHEFSLVDSTTGRLIPMTDTAGFNRYPTYTATNVAGVLGLRALTFTRMRGLDALAAEQDVGTGTQIAAMAGLRPPFDRPLRNAFASVDVYAGGRTRRNFIAARFETESRVDLERVNWNHLVSSGRAAWYATVQDGWTSELSLEAAGVWRPILPVQLELGERQTGVRGYAGAREAGGQRVVARLDQRFDFARYQVTKAAIGGAVFADAGRLWSGDVPFGVRTPIRASVGVAILAAIPARSQRTIRVELAMPLSDVAGAGPQLRFIVREPSRGFWYEPRRIRWARLSAVPDRIFNWP